MSFDWDHLQFGYQGLQGASGKNVAWKKVMAIQQLRYGADFEHSQHWNADHIIGFVTDAHHAEFGSNRDSYVVQPYFTMTELGYQEARFPPKAINGPSRFAVRLTLDDKDACVYSSPRCTPALPWTWNLEWLSGRSAFGHPVWPGKRYVVEVSNIPDPPKLHRLVDGAIVRNPEARQAYAYYGIHSDVRTWKHAWHSPPGALVEKEYLDESALTYWGSTAVEDHARRADVYRAYVELCLGSSDWCITSTVEGQPGDHVWNVCTGDVEGTPCLYCPQCASDIEVEPGLYGRLSDNSAACTSCPDPATDNNTTLWGANNKATFAPPPLTWNVDRTTIPDAATYRAFHSGSGLE